MTTRKIDTAMWTDPWFESLDPESKLAFIYFWTNPYCTPSGIYSISAKRIENELGYGIDMVSQALEKKIAWYPEIQTVWVKNFFKYQCQNSKFAIAALKSLNGNVELKQEFIEYNSELLDSYDVLST